MKLDVAFPDKLQCLFKPARYKVLYGGRGGAKSWGIARALLVKGFGRPLRILCAREIQASIKDSVHKLLKDQIAALGLGWFYSITDGAIRGKNGTEFGFEGLRHNVEDIKSWEGADICWVEEAKNVSKASWATLIPTIRKEGSEIWISFNPELQTDETYRRFVKNPPPGAIVVKLGWRDNPWFPAVLRDEKDALRETDHDEYMNVWEGECRQTLIGAVYAKEIAAAVKEGRITRVPRDHSKPIDTFWDLGRSDKTTIWFGQHTGFDYRIVDYYENNQHALGHYLKVLQDRPYVYGTMFLPHDAQNKQLTHKLSIEGQMKEAGYRVKVVPKLSVIDGINAARTVFPNCHFDEDKCADGIQALRHYRYEVDVEATRMAGLESGNEVVVFSRNPVHDWASHAADAFRYLAVALKEAVTKPVAKQKPRGPVKAGAQSWMH